MRISSRLVANALSNYARLAVNFFVGVFFVWYVVGEITLVGYGAVAIAVGSFGISAALNFGIQQSLSRELATALASGDAARVQRTLVSALALTAKAAVVLLAVMGGLAALAYYGVLNIPPELRGVVALLFVVEGAIIALMLAVAPYTMSIFADQRVGIDNVLQVLKRVVVVAAALLAFGVLAPTGDVSHRLATFAVVRGVLGAVEIVLEVVLARLLIPTLRFRREAFDRDTYRAVAGTVWHTMQFTLSAGMSPQILMLLINLLFGLAYNGMWQIVIIMGGHARLVADAALRGIDAMAAHLHEQGQRGQIERLLARAVRYQLAAALPFVAFYIIFLVPILDLWVGGRLAKDENLAALGLTATDAIALIATMGVLNLLTETCRASTRAIERILYGMGHVRSYAWFAKWSLLLIAGGALGLMLVFKTPVVAAIPLLAVQFVYFDVLVPRAGRRAADLACFAALFRALPRPLIMTGLLAVPLVVVRTQLPSLTLSSLAALGAGTAALYLPLLLLVGLATEERGRVLQLLRLRR